MVLDYPRFKMRGRANKIIERLESINEELTNQEVKIELSKLLQAQIAVRQND